MSLAQRMPTAQEPRQYDLVPSDVKGQARIYCRMSPTELKKINTLPTNTAWRVFLIGPKDALLSLDGEVQKPQLVNDKDPSRSLQTFFISQNEFAATISSGGTSLSFDFVKFDRQNCILDWDQLKIDLGQH